MKWVNRLALAVTGLIGIGIARDFSAFDNYEIATYFLDMECVECGNLATAPTPLDRESQE